MTNEKLELTLSAPTAIDTLVALRGLSPEIEVDYTAAELSFLDTTDSSYALWVRKVPVEVRVQLARFLAESSGGDVYVDARKKIDILNAAMLAGLIPPSVMKSSIEAIKDSMSAGAPTREGSGITVGGVNVQLNVQEAIDTSRMVRSAAATPGETIQFAEAGRYAGRKS